MVKRLVKYSSVYLKGRLMKGKKWKELISNWYRHYTTFIVEVILIVKEYNHGITLDMRKRILIWILFQ